MAEQVVGITVVGRDGPRQRNLIIRQAIIAGWTGRDPAAVQKHIKELEALGVKPPATTPIFYRVSATRITTADDIQATGTASSGEVEYVLLQSGGKLWVGVGSDHTDREVETYSVTVSKQMCDKPIAAVVLAIRRGRAALGQADAALVHSREGAARACSTRRARSPACCRRMDLIGRYTNGGKALPEGSIMFCGTFAAKGGIRPADRFDYELEDPVLGRKIARRLRDQDAAGAGYDAESDGHELASPGSDSGGGPVGLFCALLLGRAGIPVRVFDTNRACRTIRARRPRIPARSTCCAKCRASSTTWRASASSRRSSSSGTGPSNTKIAEFDHAVLKDDTKHPFVIQCEQFKTAKLLLGRIEKLPNVEVLFNHTVTDVSQTRRQPSRSRSKRPRGAKHPYGRLADRRGRRPQHGAQAVRHRLRRVHLRGALPRPDDAVRFRRQSRLLRAHLHRRPRGVVQLLQGRRTTARRVCGAPCFPPTPTRIRRQDAERQDVHARMQKFFPLPHAHDIVHRNLYTIHQRVAATFAKGRVLLAGDSAHVNNSIGGMGLNGGLQDAANLAEKLIEVILNKAPSDRLLELYDKQRRTVTTEFVQAQTIANKKRLEARDAETRRRNFAELAESAADPAKAREFLLKTAMIAMQQRAASITLESA